MTTTTAHDIVETAFMQEFIRLAGNAAARGWHERNGGNLSYRMSADEVASVASALGATGEWTDIGVDVPDLAGEYFLVTGSGKFLSNVPHAPADNAAIVVIDGQGKRYAKVWGLEKGGRPTSEFPSHLMNHAIRKRVTGGQNRVIYHAHPNNVIALTFILPLTDKAFTRELWEMMTECPVIFPAGIGVLPWMVPGGSDIALATGKLMEKYSVVVWAHHGMFCSGNSFDEAFGLMDTVEKAAEIAVKVRSMGGRKQTIRADEFRALARDFNIDLCQDFLADSM